MNNTIAEEKNNLRATVNVGMSKTHEAVYCALPPFHPSENYPEYPFKGNDCLGRVENRAYLAIRQVLFLMGLDSGNYGQTTWNPLGDLIKPGNQVLIKPNLVYNVINNDLDAKLTHGSVIRAVLDFVYIAMEGKGTIVIGDSPIQGADFNKLVESIGLYSIAQFFSRLPNLKVEIVDFRTEKVLQEKDYLNDYMIVDRLKLPGDPAGYTKVTLNDESLFSEVNHLSNRFRGLMYDKKEIFKHHTGGLHEYLIPNTVFNSDLIISLPKLKTHRLTGMTGALKSIIGLIGQHSWLPHYCKGSFVNGGDQYYHPCFRKWLMTELSDRINASSNTTIKSFLIKLRKRIYRTRHRFPFKDSILYGEWYGNDTIWRTILDIFRIIRFADTDGALNRKKPRTFLTIVDGIVSGEGEGPLSPNAKNTGWIIGGLEPVAVDLVCSLLMGFDYRKIPQIQNALVRSNLKLANWSVDDIQVLLDSNEILSLDRLSEFSNKFIATEGWKGFL